ncbi:hypothetical protein FQZ97_1096020 [compost metagenome]
MLHHDRQIRDQPVVVVIVIDFAEEVGFPCPGLAVQVIVAHPDAVAHHEVEDFMDNPVAE